VVLRIAQPPGDYARVKTTKPEAAAAARIGAGLGRRKRGELLELLRPCFVRVEPWLQAGKYAAALICDLPRRNGWTLAERAGDRTPDRMQRLLSRAVWDVAAATLTIGVTCRTQVSEIRPHGCCGIWPRAYARSSSLAPSLLARFSLLE